MIGPVLPPSQLSRQRTRPTAEFGVISVGTILSLDYELAVGKERIVRTIARHFNIGNLKPNGVRGLLVAVICGASVGAVVLKP